MRAVTIGLVSIVISVFFGIFFFLLEANIYLISAVIIGQIFYWGISILDAIEQKSEGEENGNN